MGTKNLGKKVLDGRLDMQSYEGIKLGFQLVTQAFIAGEITSAEVATFRALFEAARRTLSEQRRWKRPSLMETTAGAEETPSKKEKKAIAGITHSGPFAIYEGGKS